MFLVVSTLAGVLVAGLVIPLAGAVGVTTRMTIDSFESLPSVLPEPPLPESSAMYDAAGRRMATFYDENRKNVPLAQISKNMQKAIVAIEDSRFYEHGPLDLRGTVRALVRNQQAGGSIQQGGSSITQQYVKLVLFESADTKEKRAAAIDDTYERKLQELRYAVGLEEKYSKDQILEKYLNIVYFGDNVYGVEAAAKHFFSTKAAKLTLTQAAMLAALVRDPNGLEPFKDFEPVKSRRNLVMSRMHDLGMIDAATYTKYSKAGNGLKKTETKRGCFNSNYPFFCDYALEVLLNEPALGRTKAEREKFVYEGGIQIFTTIDRETQRGAENSIRKAVNATDSVYSAVSLVQPGTGHIKAIAQSRPYGEGKGKTYVNYNVPQKYNGGIGVQPGSTFKTFVMAAAIKQGVPLSVTLPTPAKMHFGRKDKIPTCTKPWSTDDWNPGNSTGGKLKQADMMTAAAQSINTFFINLERRTGLCDPATIAASLGIERGDGEKLEQVGSFTLGVNEVTPLSMAEAYATFAARGKHCDAIAVTKVLDRKGNRVEIPGANCKQVLPPTVADGVNYALRGVVDGDNPSRSGKKMSMAKDGIQVAGKTGTNDDRYAVSFAGYTTNMAGYAVVQDAHPRLRTLMNQRIGGEKRTGDEVWGGALAGPIWLGAMKAAMQGKKAAPFVDPNKKTLEGIKVKVPTVLGYGPNKAKRILEKAGFSVIMGDDVYSNREPGTVGMQTPQGGSRFGRGSTVTLHLSKGPSPAPPPIPPGPGPGDPFPPKPPFPPGPGGPRR